MDVIGPMPYSVVNTLFDAGFPADALNYWKSNFLSGLSDDAIDTMVARFAECPSPMSGLLLEHFHGAATRVAPTATAFPHRTPGFNMLVAGEWMDPAQTAVNTDWTRGTYAAMSPHSPPDGTPTISTPTRSATRAPWLPPSGPSRAPARSQAPLRPRQRVPSQPEHQALTGR